MTATAPTGERRFTIKPAVRSPIALRIGLVGPSGAGKTYSALRLATGICETTGGGIVLLDTENHRARHYADAFTFQHLDFTPPFGSCDYRAALKAASTRGPGVIIIDSLSHEHDGQGGLLDAHDQELARLAGDDPAASLRLSSIAWRKPKAERRLLLAELLRTDCHLIICLRAAERTRTPREDSAAPQEMGFTPITGPEFMYELTCSALLYPGCDGRPVWKSALAGEAAAIKRPGHLIPILGEGKPLSEEAGRRLAFWAAGTDAGNKTNAATSRSKRRPAEKTTSRRKRPATRTSTHARAKPPATPTPPTPRSQASVRAAPIDPQVAVLAAQRSAS